MKQLVFILLFIAFAVQHLSAQSGFRFSSISVDEGLNQSSVNALAEDAYGFLWFGTQEGLARYDGHQFKIYRSGPGKEELSDDFVLCLGSSGTQGLWIGTSNGLNYFENSNQRIHQLSAKQQGMNWEKANISHVASLGNEAVVVSNGVAHWIRHDEKGLTPTQTWDGKLVSSVCVQNKRVFVADIANWLWQWQSDGTKSKLKQLQFAPAGMKYEEENLLLWNENLLEVHNGNNTKTYTCGAEITDVAFSDGRLWIATNEGLEFIEDEQLKVEVTDTKSQPISSEVIMSITALKNGSIVLGTQRYGAYVWSPQSLAFQHLPGHLLLDPIVWTVDFHGNELFVGSNGGLDLFEVDEDFFDLNSLYPEHGLKKAAQWTDLHPCALLREGNLLWIGTTDHHVLLFEKREGLWEEKERFEFGDAQKFYSFSSDSSGSIAIASNTGVFYGIPGEHIDSLFLDKKIPDTNVSRYSHHVNLHENELWISSTTGLYAFNRDLHTFRNFKSDKSEGDLPSMSVASSMFTSSEDLFVATLGSGFAIRSAEEEDFTSYGLADGLVNDYVYGFVEGQKGVWGSCNEGNFLFANNHVRSFPSVPEVPFLEHSQNAFGTLKGIPWFGGIDGLYLINEAQVLDEYLTFPLLITEVLVNYSPLEATSKSTLTGSEFFIEKIDLVEANNLSLQLSIPGLTNHNAVVSYRLDQQEWLQLNSFSQRINFTSLSDGDHLLEIGLSSTKSSDAQVLKSIPISVHPPFWKSTWFILFLIICVIVIVVFILNTRNKRILKEERLKRESFERVKNERERISMDLHDNIGAQITHVITSLDNLSYKITRDQSHNAQDEVEGLSDFARGTMQQLRDTIWTMNREHIQLNDFVVRVQDYLGRILADRPRPRFSIVNASTENVTITPELAIHLFRVIQEASTNSLKHADAEHLSIEFKATQDQIAFTFTDDGKGFTQKEEQGDHYGIRNMKSRIQRLKGEFHLHSKEGEGTLLTISVPLK